MTATTAATAPTAPRDRYGFPLKSCTRCGGSGAFGPLSVNAGRCFKCGGTGWIHLSKKVADQAAALRAAQVAAFRPTVAKISAGDEITSDVSYSNRVLADATWRVVESVTVTTEWCGSSLIGTDESKRVNHYYRLIAFTDGTSVKTSEFAVWARRGVTVDPTPFVAAATTRARKS